MSAVHVITASSSGHTEYVVDVLEAYLQEKHPEVSLTRQRAEEAQPEDLLRGDVLLLGSGTWNTGGTEGQLNPHMFDLLNGRAKDMDLDGKPVGIIALGDDRYFYTARAGEHLRAYIKHHNGTVFGQPLTIINEPYSQEERVHEWAEHFAESLQSLPES